MVFITGDPRPNGTSVQWYKDGVQLTEELKSELSINILMTGALFFEGITDMKHAGNYTALVSNSAGVSTALLLVTVLSEFMNLFVIILSACVFFESCDNKMMQFSI